MSTWQNYLRAARDDLLSSGVAVTPCDVVDHALGYPGARDLFEAEAEGRAHSAARRLASALLRDTEQPDSDEETGSLFEGLAYSAPRCVTVRDDEGEVRHKAIEHATEGDCDSYEAVLEDNIRAATQRLFDWRGFRAQIASDLSRHGTIGEALRARSTERAPA